ncbi:basic salivary proline-rich protein 4-like [Lontra canadensis]|uniref:basic salivary proline-rich protein 4-like n=1 Tax=Lontra canadensis TaxID=76717 RepID=UPI0013F38E22|nr:basic salivary proline-rich protein 4-like [Lontra canadensis]
MLAHRPGAVANGTPGAVLGGQRRTHRTEWACPQSSSRGPAAFPTPGDNTFVLVGAPSDPSRQHFSRTPRTRCPEEAASRTPNHPSRKSPPRPHEKVVKRAASGEDEAEPVLGHAGCGVRQGGKRCKVGAGGARPPAVGRPDSQGSKPPEARASRPSRRRKRPACRTPRRGLGPGGFEPPPASLPNRVPAARTLTARVRRHGAAARRPPPRARSQPRPRARPVDRAPCGDGVGATSRKRSRAGEAVEKRGLPSGPW